MPLLLLIFSGIFALTLVFIACELGQRLNNAFDRINLTIDRFNWYLFPNEVKCMLPMIIVLAQQPVSLECYGSIVCTRDVFKDVCNDDLVLSLKTIELNVEINFMLVVKLVRLFLDYSSRIHIFYVASSSWRLSAIMFF